MATAVKTRDLGQEESSGKKAGEENLRGKVIIINPEESEIAENLEIKEKGVYGVKFR
tara:strand:+ start:2879 stop:3049 length:171 start_codon:yes stop_codon:yes gene_type:complete